MVSITCHSQAAPSNFVKMPLQTYDNSSTAVITPGPCSVSVHIGILTAPCPCPSGNYASIDNRSVNHVQCTHTLSQHEDAVSTTCRLSFKIQHYLLRMSE